MTARLLFFSVIYQTIITISLGQVKIPVSNSVGKVFPIKPRPSSSSSVWDGEDILPELFSSSIEGPAPFKSPVALTLSSKPLAVPKIDVSIADVKLPPGLNLEAILPKLPIISKRTDITPEISLPYAYNIFPKIRPLTRKLNEDIPESINRNYYTPELNPSLSVCKELFSRPVPSFTDSPVLGIPNSNSGSSKSIISSKKINTNSVPNLTSLDSPWILEVTKPVSPELTKYNSDFIVSNKLSPNISPLSSIYPMPYPLFYKSMYLPRVRTPSNINSFPYESVSSLRGRNLSVPSQYGASRYPYESAPVLPSHRNPMKTIEIPKTFKTVQIPKTTSNIPFSTESIIQTGDAHTFVDFESKIIKPSFLTTNLCNENLKAWPSTISEEINYSTELPKFSDISSTTRKMYKPFFPSKPSTLSNTPTLSTVSITPSSTESLFPELDALAKNTNNLNTNTHFSIENGAVFNTPKIISSSILPATATSILPLATFPSTSPVTICQTPSPISQVSSNIVTSINDLVSDMTQNILSNYKTYLSSATNNLLEIPKCAAKSNPYLDSKPKQILSSPSLASSSCTIPTSGAEILLDRTQLPPANLQDNISGAPVLSLSLTDVNSPTTNLPIGSPINCPTAAPIVSISESSLPFLVNQLSPVLSQPVSTTILPLTASVSFLTPTLCPTYLPSPTLPSYPAISSPFFIESPVYKVSKNKDDNDLNKILELMLIAEILNEEESFNWDDLDTLLALLSLS